MKISVILAFVIILFTGGLLIDPLKLEMARNAFAGKIQPGAETDGSSRSQSDEGDQSDRE